MTAVHDRPADTRPIRTPIAPREGEPTVRELLDAGAARVDRELAGRPELQADIMTVIGRVYQRLNLDDKARPLLEQALARAREADGPSSVRVAQSLNDLGVQMRDVDWRAERRAPQGIARDAASAAGQRGRESRDHARRAGPHLRGPRDGRRRRAAAARGARDPAEGARQHAIARPARSLSDLGHLLRERGDLAQAEALFRENVAITRKVLPWPIIRISRPA